MEKTKEKKQQILESAKMLFMTFSYENVGLKDIAKDAGVERTVISNFFFAKEYLYDKVFESIISEFTLKIPDIAISGIFDKDKIKKYINLYFDVFISNSKLLIFILSYLHRMEKINYQRNSVSNFYNIEVCTKIILKDIEENNNFQNNSVEFVISLMSLFSYPFSLQRLINTIRNYNKVSYENFIIHRKERIIEILKEYSSNRTSKI